jgi:hypothetical protein
MALQTKARFYYGPEVLQNNSSIDFNEGASDLIASVPVRIYSPSELAKYVTDAMNLAGTQEYSVFFDRITRKITISAAANFDLLVGSGAHAGSSLWDNLGFTGVTDLTGSNTYTGASVVGSTYEPQFYLLDYVPLDDWEEAVESSINKTGSGKVEVIKYGTERFTQFSIELITNKPFKDDGLWTPDLQGIENARSFMRGATSKSIIELMPDRSDPNTYELLILEKTEQNQNGVGFKLLEMSDLGDGYKKTGLLIFRETSL